MTDEDLRQLKGRKAFIQLLRQLTQLWASLIFTIMLQLGVELLDELLVRKQVLKKA